MERDTPNNKKIIENKSFNYKCSSSERKTSHYVTADIDSFPEKREMAEVQIGTDCKVLQGRKKYLHKWKTAVAAAGMSLHNHKPNLN